MCVRVLCVKLSIQIHMKEFMAFLEDSALVESFLSFKYSVSSFCKKKTIFDPMIFHLSALQNSIIYYGSIIIIIFFDKGSIII